MNANVVSSQAQPGVRGLLLASIFAIAVILASALVFLPGRAAAFTQYCYWVDSSCGYGYMDANTPTAWTPNYTVDVSNMTILYKDSPSTETLQIRPYTGASGYSWSYYGRGDQEIYPIQSVQSRCFDSGPGHRWTTCNSERL